MKFLLTLIFTVTTAFSNTRLQKLAGKQVHSDTTVYMIVQVPPVFPGGNAAMFRFIQANSKYLVSLNKGSLVQLRLLVEKDGSVSEIKTIYADLDDDFVQEAKRIAKAMPKWIPGSQDERLLRSYTIVPVRFVDAKNRK